MIARYDPAGRLLSLRQLMDRLMEEAFVLPRAGPLAPLGNLALNVYEEGDSFVVEAQLPGVRPDELEVSIERGVLTIRAEARAEEERRERNYLLRELRRASFLRSLQLPETIETERVQASFEQGVLRLVFPKAEQAKARRIAVGSGGQQAPLGPGPRAEGAGQPAAGAGQPAAAGASAQSGEQRGAAPNAERGGS